MIHLKINPLSKMDIKYQVQHRQKEKEKTSRRARYTVLKSTTKKATIHMLKVRYRNAIKVTVSSRKEQRSIQNTKP